MKQGEIWQINLDPTVGSEMKKSRPCIILNGDIVGKLPLKVIAPLTDYKERYEAVPWMVTLEANQKNGLEKKSTIDLFQVRSVSQKRLVKKIGLTDAEILEVCKESLNVVFE